MSVLRRGWSFSISKLLPLNCVQYYNCFKLFTRSLESAQRDCVAIPSSAATTATTSPEGTPTARDSRQPPAIRVTPPPPAGTCPDLSVDPFRGGHVTVTPDSFRGGPSRIDRSPLLPVTCRRRRARLGGGHSMQDTSACGRRATAVGRVSCLHGHDTRPPAENGEERRVQTMRREINF